MKKSRRRVARKILEEILDRKMSAYSATAAAVLLAGGTSAQAGIKYTAANISLTGPSASYSLDLNGDGNTDVSFSVSSGSTAGSGPFSRSSGSGSSLVSSTGSSAWSATWRSVWATAATGARLVVDSSGAVALDASVQIGPNNAWGSSWQELADIGQWSNRGFANYFTHTSGSNMTLAGSTSWGPYKSSGSYGNFLGQSGKYLGVEFQIAGQTHYGWVQIDVNDEANEATINGYAYEDVAGAAIHAGTVPEPGSLAMLAIGAAGIAARRRRKAAA